MSDEEKKSDKEKDDESSEAREGDERPDPTKPPSGFGHQVSEKSQDSDPEERIDLSESDDS